MRHYAIQEKYGKRILIEIECDKCGNTIKPNPSINKSGWRVHGQDRGPGTEKLILDYCPACDLANTYLK